MTVTTATRATRRHAVCRKHASRRAADPRPITLPAQTTLWLVSVGIASSEAGTRVGLSIFLSVDPVEGGCANNYMYVHGDPLNTADLDGMVQRCAGAFYGGSRGRIDIIEDPMSPAYYTIYVELFPAENPLATEILDVKVGVEINGKDTNFNFGAGHPRPIGDLFHSRQRLLNRSYKNSGDAPWTHHHTRAGDILKFEVKVDVAGPNGYTGTGYADLTCQL